MRLPHFVSGSAVILLGWLVLTFTYQVPSQRYQKPEKPESPVTTKDPAAPEARDASGPSQVFPISFSR